MSRREMAPLVTHGLVPNGEDGVWHEATRRMYHHDPDECGTCGRIAEHTPAPWPKPKGPSKRAFNPLQWNR